MKTKNVYILIIVIFAISSLHAQNILLTFAGTGQSTTVDSVQIQNLTQCTYKTINGTDNLNLVDHVGIQENNADIDQQLLIYPNPTAENSTIQFVSYSNDNFSIAAYDMFGRLVTQTEKQLQPGKHTFIISGLNNGIYNVVVKNKNANQTKTLVCQNHAKADAGIQYASSISFKELNTSSIKTKSIVQMQFNNGDWLLFRAYSGNYCTVSTLAPTVDTTMTSIFEDCTDADNNHYAIVKIGTQTWMAENLRTSKYRNNIDIPEVADTNWIHLTSGAFCWYANDSAAYDKIFGKLYNWYAIDTLVNGNTDVCPVGWHVPLETEWQTMQTLLGGWTIAGVPLKENCNTLWDMNNPGNNHTGFTGRPSGYRSEDGTFWDKSNYRWARYWTSVEWAYAWWLSYDNPYLAQYCTHKAQGLSVRCIKD